MNHTKDEMEIDLRELAYVLKKRILVILITAVVFAGASGVYSFFIADPVYESTSRLYIQTQSTSITSLADIQVGSSLALDYVELIQSRTLVEEVIQNLSLDTSYQQLKGRLTVVNPADTRILNISIQGTDAAETTQIANEFASVAQKQISAIMKTDEPSLWEMAVLPDAPVKPEKTKNVAMGFILGAVLAAAVVIAMHLFNDALRTPDDIERHLGLNNLATIPYEGEKKKEKRKKKKGGA